MSDARDTLEMDVVFVGAGPASLAGAYHLARLVREHDAAVAAGTRPGPALGEVSIAILEKGPDVGSHGLSGAVLDPGTLRALVPDFAEKGAPVTTRVSRDDVYLFTHGRALRLPLVPPALHNEGNYVVSLGRLVAWMATLCEEAGVSILPETPAVQLLEENGRITGVRTGDKGVSRTGEKKSTYEPGVDLVAKLTVLGEGPRGTLVKQLLARRGLPAGRNPQVYSTGVKELWEFPAGAIEAGRVIHTMGWPLPSSTFGGGFIYGSSDHQLAVGFVTGLDSRDATTDPHGMLQRYKEHPFVRDLLRGGRMVGYGAKAIPEGGWYSVPRLADDGVLLVGDSAGFLNPARLKGIHLAIASGMLAAETALEALRSGDTSRAGLAAYETRVEQSVIGAELRSVRLFHQGFRHGFLPGLVNAGLQFASGGRLALVGPRAPAGHEEMRRVNGHGGPGLAATQTPYDGERTFTKLLDVHYSGTRHDEDQPCHLVISARDQMDICNGRCREEYGNPCQYFCPAHVYEMVEADGGGTRLQINASNCVHCKTCDIADPYQVITWVPPEGGGGPRYLDL